MGSTDKAEIRTRILAARRALAPEVHDAEADALCGHLPDAVGAAPTVCAYVPTRFEPGSITLLDKLLQLGKRVLLPVAGDTPAPLQWGDYRAGRLIAANFGLREPPQPWLTAEAIGDAAVVLVPALAVDRRGVRLGRGAGFYDRTLGLADPAAHLVAVVRDDELVDALPADDHDVAMTHALTPGHGLVRVG